MKLYEDKDYKLIGGSRLFPIGRRYKTLHEIKRPNGEKIPTGYKWDGGTGMPHSKNYKAAYAFLIHDYAYSKKDMSFVAANVECVKQLMKDTNILYALLIAIMFILLSPTLFVYWITDGQGENKTFVRLITLASLIGNIVLIGFLAA